MHRRLSLTTDHLLRDQIASGMQILTSPEFVDLCRAQVVLLSESLGAVSSSVYLTEGKTEHGDAELIPIVTYPEMPQPWRDASPSMLPPSLENSPALKPRSLAAESGLVDAPTLELRPEGRTDALVPAAHPHGSSESAGPSVPPGQMVLPLIHEGTVMGLLVTVRNDRPWNAQEQAQLESVAHTLAIARLLDQRGQWFEHDLHDKRLFQAQQNETFHDLLHQFRNPLTALRTFGKLLLRRLQSEDPNRSVAEGIVRESDRLRDLLDQFRETVDLGDAEWVVEPSVASLPAPEISIQADRVAPAGEGVTESTPASGSTPPLLPGSSLVASLNLHPCWIEEILRPLLISADAIAQERNLALKVDLPDDLPPIQADVKALREVFSNLLDNALKYSPSGATIYVGAGLQRPVPQLDDPTLTLNAAIAPPLYQGVVIADNGPGIPLQDLKHVFERHYRGVQAQTDIPGTGLGLAIAQELVQHMQGEIQVFSPASSSGLVPSEPKVKHPAPGTAFVVWLPEIRRVG